MNRLRILTCNIAHGRGLSLYQGLHTRRRIEANLRRVARLIEACRADIVALQEIDFDASWSGNFDHLAFLREHTKLPHSAFGVNNSRGGRYRLHYGNALLSRLPIDSWETHAFGSRHLGEKGFLFAEVRLGKRLLPIINLHLHHRSRVRRLEQAEQVVDFALKRHEERGALWAAPPVVCGDLNNSPGEWDATARLLEHFRLHGDYTLHPVDTRTFPSYWPRRAIDFIFLPPLDRPAHCEVLRGFVSDHCPVLVDFTV